MGRKQDETGAVASEMSGELHAKTVVTPVAVGLVTTRTELAASVLSIWLRAP